MHEIKIPNGQPKKTEGDVSQRPLNPNPMQVSQMHSAPPQMAPEPSDKIKVKFEKFVQLVAMHNFSEVMKKHAHEDIVLSANLLTDLANAHEDVEEKSTRVPLYLAIGALIGIVLTYLIVRF